MSKRNQIRKRRRYWRKWLKMMFNLGHSIMARRQFRKYYDHDMMP